MADDRGVHIFSVLKGTFSFCVFALNTAFWGALIYLLIPFKFLLPSGSWRRFVTEIMVRLGENWISVNSTGLDLVQRIEWDVRGLDGLRPDRSYLVISNHRSWVDIVVLQKIFNRRIPFLRFFLKRQLLYVPVLGGAWWALDFPFMRRHSKEYLEKHPERKGQDAAVVREACRRFQGRAISVLNFLEGTRFRPEKHDRQKSPYRHLLVPKAGGVAFVIESMGEQFEAVVDVTIHYPGGRHTFWDLLSGAIRKVVIRVRVLPVPAELTRGCYLDDAASRERAQGWVREIWTFKDALLTSLGAQTEPG